MRASATDSCDTSVMTRNSHAEKVVFGLVLVCAAFAVMVVRPFVQQTPADRDWIRSYIGFSSEESQFTFVVTILIVWITLWVVLWLLKKPDSSARLIDCVMNDRFTQAALLSIGAGLFGLFASIARFAFFTL